VQALQAVAEAVAADLPVHGLAAVHRTGLLAVGDVAVVVAASAAHRGQAFEAARRLIDDLKAACRCGSGRCSTTASRSGSERPERPARTYAPTVLPAWLMWLLPVPVATLAAVVWSSWSARARPQDPEDTVEQYAGSRRARTVPRGRARAGRRPAGRTRPLD
jgi:hypothetical protein